MSKHNANGTHSTQIETCTEIEAAIEQKPLFARMTLKSEIGNAWPNCIVFELGDARAEDKKILFSISPRFD
jgi:hypothetical protein